MIEGVMITKKLYFTKKIREVKTKHTWSIEIMKELIERASIYECADPAGPYRDQEEPSDDAENPIEVIKKAGKYINIYVYRYLYIYT